MNRLLSIYRPRVDIANTALAKADLVSMYDQMTSVPLYSLISHGDCLEISKIISSPEYIRNPKAKYQMINSIMMNRGFYMFHGGTNRNTYVHMYTNIMLKVATDKIGIENNINEFHRQHMVKPYCYKIFEVSSCGVIALGERVTPILTQEQFMLHKENIFNILYFIIKAKNILVDDIGTASPKNWGVREGFGPVLIDFPSMFIASADKLSCSSKLHNLNTPCNGVIGYDEGFNNIYCTKCGAKYIARSLSVATSIDNKIDSALMSATDHINYSLKNERSSKGNMKVQFEKDGEVLSTIEIIDGRAIVHTTPEEIDQKMGYVEPEFTENISENNIDDADDDFCEDVIDVITPKEEELPKPERKKIGRPRKKK